MLEFSIAADLALVDQATANVLEFASQQAKDVDRFRLALVLREALSNAIVHGANCDPSQRIDLRLTFDSEAMEFVLEVEDPGDGFDHETLTSIPDATATSGRGCRTTVQRLRCGHLHHEHAMSSSFTPVFVLYI